MWQQEKAWWRLDCCLFSSSLLPGLRDCDTDDDIAMHFLRNSEGFEKYLQYLIGQSQAESAISEKEVHQYFKVGLQKYWHV